MLLNRKHYQALWDKYKNIEMLTAKFDDNVSILTTKIILEKYKCKQSIHFNFQNSYKSLQNIGQHLFVELANDIYLNYADLHTISEGHLLKRKKDNKYYRVVRVVNNRYILKEEPSKHRNHVKTYGSATYDLPYDKIVKTFVNVDAGIAKKTINNYFNFFKDLNNRETDFLQTHFDYKSVFIAPKTFYDSLEVKNKIPTTYFPNPREEANPQETKSIALTDSIMYIVPKYEICHDTILLARKKIHTIVVFDHEENEIEQIIQDKNKFDFNLIVLTRNVKPTKYSQVPFWNWFKEELQIINAL